MNATLQKNFDLPRWQGIQRRIGITGGIATGKSSLGNFLKEIKGIPIIDADLFAHRALAPGTIASQKILNRHGTKVSKINSKDSIDRLALARIIFKDNRLIV